MNVVFEYVRQVLRPTPAWLGLAAGLILVGIGLAAIAVAEPVYAGKQIEWLCIGLFVMVLAMLVHPRTIGVASVPLMVVTLLLLILLIVPGVPRSIVPTINGARAWIDLQFMSFQPSEAAKIAVVLVVARYLRYRDNYRTLRGLLLPFVIVAVPVILILKQPDLGSAILFFPALFVMLVAAGAKLRHMGSLVLIGVLAVVLTVTAIYTLPESMQNYVLKAHQRERIVAMISMTMGDTSQNQSTNYQQDRAMTLAGSGGFSGYGAERSPTIVRLNALPHDHNDMIFAVVCNRFGFVGGLSTIALYFIMIASFLLVAARSKDPFARLVIVGFCGFIGVQATINIAQTLGLLPVTGITLPFVSYGGTSMLVSFAMVGLVMNFAWRRPTILARPSFEFDNADAIFQ